jgi:hypothetical protein
MDIPQCQHLASFHVLNVGILALSPGSHRLAYTTYSDNKIYVCNTPPNILANIEPATEGQYALKVGIYSFNLLPCNDFLSKTGEIFEDFLEVGVMSFSSHCLIDKIAV